MQKKILKLVFVTFFVSLCLPSAVRAEPKAKSDYNVHIELNEQNEALITYHIHLVNQSNDFTIRDYSLQSYHSDLFELSVSENGGSSDFRKQYIDDRIKIKIPLKNELVAQGEDTNFVISYKTNQVITHDGFVKQLYIPPIKTEEDLGVAYFTFVVPENFSEVSYSSLKKLSFSTEDGKRILKFAQREAPYGVLFQFGYQQQFEFEYNYRLENTESEVKTFAITLPVDSQFQTVYITNISEYPERTLRDKTGNNIIEYTLGPKDKKDIRIVGYTNFSLDLSEIVLTSDEIQYYTQQTELWDYSSPEILSIINSITRKDYSPYENASFIYEYITSNFTYTDEDKERKKASEVFNLDDDLSCANITDLYVTFLRGAGIPARKVAGYTTVVPQLNSLHYWVEFYDDQKKLWIAVDPCLDMHQNFYEFENINVNRIILAYWGISDTSPEVVVPFSKLQDLEKNTLELYTSSFHYISDLQNIDINYEIGGVDILMKKTPLHINITNNSQNMFLLGSIMMNNQLINTDLYIDDVYTETIFPGSEKSILGVYTENGAVPIEKIRNYTIDLSGNYGLRAFIDKQTIDKSDTFDLHDIGPWIVASVIALLTLIIALSFFKKLPTINLNFPNSHEKGKKKWHKSGSFEI